jgi:phosphosulfolactate phosphohydrolase-like enzyme
MNCNMTPGKNARKLALSRGATFVNAAKADAASAAEAAGQNVLLLRQCANQILSASVHNLSATAEAATATEAWVAAMMKTMTMTMTMSMSMMMKAILGAGVHNFSATAAATASVAAAMKMTMRMTMKAILGACVNNLSATAAAMMKKMTMKVILGACVKNLVAVQTISLQYVIVQNFPSKQHVFPDLVHFSPTMSTISL